MMSIFTTSAKYYEVFSDSDTRLNREGPFLLDALHQSQGFRVVDIACGTGLHAEFFAQNGASVDAFDISDEMIEYARTNRSCPSINFHTGDMRSLSGGPWDLAICLGNSISVLSTNEDLRKTFKSVFSSLGPNGVFVIQILNYQAEAHQKPRHRIELKKAGNVDVVAVKTLVPHEDMTFLSLSFYALSGDEHESISETAVLKNRTRDELVSTAEDADFTVEAVYGGYDRSDFNSEESNDVVCVFRKG